MKFKPHPYQNKGIKFGVERQHAGFFLEPGLGKTSISLAIFKILRAQGFVNSLLVLAPLRAVYSVWPKEIQKWDDFKGLSVGILHGPNKNEILEKKFDVYVINYDGLHWLVEHGLPSHINMLVADESSKLKNTMTIRYKTLKKILHKFKRRYILTGSPVANSLMDIFGQCFIMDMGVSFGPRFTHFREEFFSSTGYMGYDWKLKPGAEKAIQKRVAPRVLHMAAKDYLDLPPLIIKDVLVTLPDKAMRIYKQMETALRVDFEAGRVTAANAAVATGKCRQIANGGLYTNGEDWELIHDAKSEAISDIVDELSGQPALISYDFVHDMERLRNTLGKNTPYIGGGVSAGRGAELEEMWNRGEIKCLLGNLQSVAHALNLQSSPLGGSVIAHSLPWSFDIYDQLIKRVWRQGQKRRVVVHRIIAVGTIDEAIIRTLASKAKTQNTFFKALKEYFQ